MFQRAASPHRSGDRHGNAHDGRNDGRHDGHHDRPAGHPAWRAAAPADHHPDARPRRAHAANPARARNAAKDFTFGHAGRQVRIGPVAFWICVGALVIMAAWSAVTSTYFAFHDDVLARLIAREAAMQFAYEDRIA